MLRVFAGVIFLNLADIFDSILTKDNSGNVWGSGACVILE
jgi:hypothetical protein